MSFIGMEKEKVSNHLEGQIVRAMTIEITLTPTAHITIVGEDYEFFADWLPEYGEEGRKTILRTQGYESKVEYEVYDVRWFDVIDMAQDLALKHGRTW